MAEKTKLTQPRGAAVLGMHRSGTSAVAGFLAKAGLYAGEATELLAPAEDNPKGFFEREDVNALNDQLLAELGGAWDRPPKRELVERVAPQWQRRVEETINALAAQSGGTPLVIKDPRISLVLPAWLPALDAGFTVVLVDRNPVDVALSIRKRDQRPVSVALALWQLYWAEILDGLAGRRVIVVRYEDFIADPTTQGQALLAQLSEALPEASLDAAAASGFVSSGMRHHQTAAGSDDEADVLTGSQAKLWRWLSDLPAGWAELSPPPGLQRQPEAALVAASEYYDAMGDRHGMETAYDLERHRALHFEQATELKDRHIENLESAIEHLNRRLEEETGRAEEATINCGRLDEEVASLRAQLEASHQHGSRGGAVDLLSVAKRALSGH
ncbi:MAG TPA: sulfotransferase [Acidimicrobiales bacterium]|nr:sulfotransferase [Acidimicrobiales bacterium]